MSADAKKRGLGRGLDALFQDVKTEQDSFAKKASSNASKTSDKPALRADEMVNASKAMQNETSGNAGVSDNNGARLIAIDKLTPGKSQPRRVFDDGALDDLAKSIKNHGVLQPLLVRPLTNKTFEIIAGERRWRASQRAKLHEVPVVIQEMSDEDALEIALIENLQREDLSSIEEAEGYQRLMDQFGHTQEQLAKQLGKSRPHIANTLRLLKLPKSVRAMVEDGTLSTGHARALIGAADPEKLAGIIIKQKLNVRQTEELVAEVVEGKVKPKTKKTKGFTQKDVDVLALEKKMTTSLGMVVKINGKGKSGKLVVEYKNLDQLDDVIKRLQTTPK